MGTQSLDVCERQGFEIAALAGGGSRLSLLAEQARRWRPAVVAVADESRYAALKGMLADLDCRVTAGPDGLCEAAAYAGSDIVLNCVVGIAGLRPTLAAIGAGKNVALANKETLVTGGALVTRAAREKGVSVLPVDSEHSAIFQCLQAGARADVRGVILTASGGPFYGKTAAALAQVTCGQALAHPTWSMGPKITVDSATLMNKGLEFIEAMWLFDLAPEQIEIVVHRQSVVHSAVEFRDGSVIAQLGTPDMRLAIQYALTYPAHLPLDTKRLSLADIGALTFARPDADTFRCLRACLAAARRGGLAPAVVNGANEEAVALFLDGGITFTGIGALVEGALEGVRADGAVTLDSIEEADRRARAYVRENRNPLKG